MITFDPDFAGRFQLFTGSHIVTMIAIALSWIFIPLIFKKLGSPKADKAFRYTLAILLTGQYLLWMLWEAATGRFTVQLSLPVNLCDFSNFLCAVLLITTNYKLYEVLYFWALAGTIQSFITPNIFFSFPHYEFYAFYIQHGGEILTILYLTFVTGHRPQLRSCFKATWLLLLFCAFVYAFNLITQSNYMFLMADTPHPSTVTKMIRIFGEPPRHIIGLAIVSLASVFILYLPFAVKDLLHRQKQSK